MLGIANQPEVGVVFGLHVDALRARKAFKGRASAFLTKIARNGAREFLYCHRGTPQTEARRDRREIGRHKGVGLQALYRRRLPPQRETDVEKDIQQKTPSDPVHQRRQIESEQVLWPQHAETRRPVGEDALPDYADVGQGWEKKGIAPHQKTGSHASDGSGRSRATPQEAAEE